MPYSEIKVVAGGLAHIPIIIGFFYFIQNKIFARKTETPDTSVKTAKTAPTPTKKISSPPPPIPSPSSNDLGKAKTIEISKVSTEGPQEDSTSNNDSGSPSSNKLEK